MAEMHTRQADKKRARTQRIGTPREQDVGRTQTPKQMHLQRNQFLREMFYRPTHYMRIKDIEKPWVFPNEATSNVGHQHNLCKRNGLATHLMLVSAEAAVNVL